MTKDKELELLAKARKDYQSDNEAMADIYKSMEDDLNFVNGEQWDGEIRAGREADGRPCLTINKLFTTVNQVANDHRQNRPRGKATPVDDSTDNDTAEVINGLLYHIQNRSDSESAFDTAEEFAISGGVGFFRIHTDYCDPESFEQEILVKRIDNPFSVLFPVNQCSEPDWSDASHCFVIDKITREEYERRFGDNPQNWDSSALGDVLWSHDDDVSIAEYWTVEIAEKTIYKLADGSTVDKLPDGVVSIKNRTTEVRTVKWYLLSAGKVLDEKEWPSKWIPIIPVLGREINIKGKKSYISLVRFAKDPQRNLNFWKSAQTERIALAPLAPYIGAEGQFSGYEAEWAKANRKTIPYLEYKTVSIAGTLVPAPRRVDPVQNDTGIIEALREANDDIKATTGIYDASLGNRGNETSGRAIIARQREGDTANFHFADNLNRAIKHATRIIIDLIPKIIDTPRAIRILGDDMTEKVVRVNEVYRDESKGSDVLYDVTAGKYDVVVSTGPSYNTKRQEAASILTELVRANPQIAVTTSDLLARFLDMPDEIVQRLKKTLPTGLAEEEGKDGKMSDGEIQQIVGDMQKLMAENQMSKEQMQQMQAIIQRLESDLKAKTDDNAARIEVAQINGEAKVATEVIKAQSSRDVTNMKVSAEQAKEIAAAIQSIVSGGGSPENAIKRPVVAQSAMNQ